MKSCRANQIALTRRQCLVIKRWSLIKHNNWIDDGYIRIFDDRKLVEIARACQYAGYWLAGSMVVAKAVRWSHAELSVWALGYLRYDQQFNQCTNFRGTSSDLTDHKRSHIFSIITESSWSATQFEALCSTHFISSIHILFNTNLAELQVDTAHSLLLSHADNTWQHLSAVPLLTPRSLIWRSLLGLVGFVCESQMLLIYRLCGPRELPQMRPLWRLWFIELVIRHLYARPQSEFGQNRRDGERWITLVRAHEFSLVDNCWLLPRR